MDRMFAKPGSSGLTPFLAQDTADSKSGIDQRGPQQAHRETASCRLVVQRSPSEGGTEELFEVDRPACLAMLKELAESAPAMILQDLPIEDVARFCFEHGYRWRFHKVAGGHFAFLLEPAKTGGTDPNPRKP